MDKPKEIELKIMIFGCILVILLLAISIIVFFVIYQKRILAQQIRLQHVRNDYQQQLLSSSIEIQEKERVRIGHDLHDGIGSSLSAIKLLINQVQWHDEESQRIVAGVKDVLTNTIQDVRNISMDLYPSVLEKFGLQDALQHLVSVLSEASPLIFNLKVEDIPSLTYSQNLALYRITQELVNNTIKHANASSVTIELGLDRNQVQLSVFDDGNGFDYEELKANGKPGIGLKSIAARIAILEADMQVYSSQGKGTQTTIRFPI